MTAQSPECITAQHKISIAGYIIKEQFPVTIAVIIEQINTDQEAICKLFGESSKEDIKEITLCLLQLQHEIETNKALTPLTRYSEDRVAWNSSLFYLTNDSVDIPSWLTSSWLYVECYMYRRIFEVFSSSVRLKDFDYFRIQKDNLFLSSYEQVLSLAQRMENMLKDVADDVQCRLSLSELIGISLWSNQYDLATVAGSRIKANPMTSLSNLQQYILDNDTPKILNYIFNTKSMQPDGLLIDFILDNAGFELFADLCLAHFLCASGLAKKIRFYVKRMPWYISDVTAMDFFGIIDAMKKMYRPHEIVLNELAQVWLLFINDSTWTVETELYWTYPFPYCEMKERNPTLYQKLSDANLLIFKGDLNYRKLTGDRLWHTTTSFETALHGFMPSPLCALRIINSESMAGLAPGQANQIGKFRKDWVISGEFGLIQFCPGV